MLHEKYTRKISSILPKIRRFAYGLCGSVVVAEDLVQEAFARLLSAGGQQEQYMEQWLFKTVRNLHIDMLRKEDIRNRHYEKVKEFSGDSFDGTGQVEGLISLVHIRQLILQLPNEQREVLLLVGVEGYSYREAAEILDLPIGTVTSRLARARNRLFDCYSDRDKPAEEELSGGVT